MKNQAECIYPSTNLSIFTKALLVTAVVIGIILAAPPAIAGPADEPVVIRLTPEAYAQAADIEAVHTIDYGTFVWLELTEASFAQVRERGVQFERQRNPEDFQIQGHAIDSRSALTSTLSAQASVGITAPNFYLVQLLGPVKDEWVKQLETSGVEILQYMDPYVHLVRMPSGNVSAVAAMDFVRWVGPHNSYYRIGDDLLGYTGVIENVDITIYDSPNAGIDGTLAAIVSLGGTLVERETGRANDMFITATFRLPASALDPVAQLGEVAWLSYRPPIDELEDEMSDQIIAGNFGPINPGYQTWLTGNGVSGSGVTVALIDTGYDTGVDATSHPDLSGRLIPVGTPTDTNGHGSHVGGIIAGNASLGTMDASNFLLGLGVAPAANLVVRVNSGTDAARQRDAVINGAVASNNSYKIHDAGIGYTSRDRTLDMLVRDADQNTASVAEPLIMVFSAGNSGTTGTTKEAKNIIAVANSLNQRTSTGTVDATVNINNLRGSSSRGPAGDGRVYPHVTAPGTNIVSTRSTQAGITKCTGIATGAGAPAANPTYSMCTGTSMAAPHVTGAVALVTEWWRGFNGGANPSPAMGKSLLVNGAVDMGTADIPNGNEGWGRINLANVINTGIATQYLDQTTVFNSTGDSWSASFSPADPGQQVKVTVTWSDAPGPGTGGNPAALVNDLDLVLSDPINTYLGNDFANGLSTTGGVADTVDNLENVFIQNPADAFTVTVTAAGINGDGVPYNGDTTDQDFALVCSNCIPNLPPVCDANGPYTAECSLNTSLDGSGSSDPDGNPLSFSWAGPFQGGTASGVSPSVVFPEPTGLKSVTLDVDDGLATRSCSAAVIVQDTLDPSISAPVDKTAECASPAGTAVALGTPIVSDICDTSVDVSNDAPPLLFPLGMTTVTWTATDDSGNQDMAAQKVTIQDTIPPELTLSVTPSVLWPPNHKLVTVNAVITVSDICDANPTVKLVSIVSNEPDNGKGDGNTVNDIQGAAFGTDDREFQLRSERSGKGNGRIYTITYEASDASGNVTTRQATVTVPHDMGS